MIIKIVSLFLIGMLVLAMFGKLRIPKIKRFGASKCKKCGAYQIGKTPCVCDQNKS